MRIPPPKASFLGPCRTSWSGAPDNTGWESFQIRAQAKNWDCSTNRPGETPRCGGLTAREMLRPREKQDGETCFCLRSLTVRITSMITGNALVTPPQIMASRTPCQRLHTLIVWHSKITIAQSCPSPDRALLFLEARREGSTPVGTTRTFHFGFWLVVQPADADNSPPKFLQLCSEKSITFSCHEDFLVLDSRIAVELLASFASHRFHISVRTTES